MCCDKDSDSETDQNENVKEENKKVNVQRGELFYNLLSCMALTLSLYRDFFLPFISYIMKNARIRSE